MRRWNGWGDDTFDYHLTENAKLYLQEILGKGISKEDVPLIEVIKAVPRSRLADHPLISTNPEERVRHSKGQSFPDWIAMRGGEVGQFPDGIAYPNSDEEIREIIDHAKHARIKLIPYGGGTSVVGHINILPSDHPVLTVDLTRMNRLIKLDQESLLATFEAGVTGSDLEAQLRAHGFTLGHYPQSFEYSTLGGWIATRSCGQQSLGFGRIEDLFTGGQLETPSGSLNIPILPASAAGPDIKELILGSEGRLGIISKATVRISRFPEREDFHAIFFPNWDSGFLAVKEIIQSQVPLSMLRYSNSTETHSTLALAGHENLIKVLEGLLSIRGVKEEKCMLLAGFKGSDSIVKTARKELLKTMTHFGGVHVGRTFGKQWHKTRFKTPYLRNTLWDLGYGIDTLETAVPWSSVNKTLQSIEDSIKKIVKMDGEEVLIFSHLSHIYPIGSSIYTTFIFRLDHDLSLTHERWVKMKHSASKAILDNGGTISHQHGIGMDHIPFLSKEKGKLGMETIKRVCQLFDPNGIMNPGKLI